LRTGGGFTSRIRAILIGFQGVPLRPAAKIGRDERSARDSSLIVIMKVMMEERSDTAAERSLARAVS
jgi:hypothetical protein